jgi:hypothetical protein
LISDGDGGRRSSWGCRGCLVQTTSAVVAFFSRPNQSSSHHRYTRNTIINNKVVPNFVTSHFGPNAEGDRVTRYDAISSVPGRSNSEVGRSFRLRIPGPCHLSQFLLTGQRGMTKPRFFTDKAFLIKPSDEENLGAWTKECYFGGGIAITCQEPSDAGKDDTTLHGEIGAPEGLNLDSRCQTQPQTPPELRPYAGDDPLTTSTDGFKPPQPPTPHTVRQIFRCCRRGSRQCKDKQ